MRVSSFWKIIVSTAVVALILSLPGTSSAKMMMRMKVPPGACAFHGKVVANGLWCSYNCNPKTQICAQQGCMNGRLVPALLMCPEPFCLPKCG